jgi:O-antigen biosynthesis protein
MLPKIFDLSSQTKSLEQKLEAEIAFNLNESSLSKDDLSGENIAKSEKAEFEIWQGIKSEREGNLLVAISHYRQAIELDSECAKAYQLLSNALKKNRQQRQSKVRRKNPSISEQRQVSVSLEADVSDFSETVEITEQSTAKEIDVLNPINPNSQESTSQIPVISLSSLIPTNYSISPVLNLPNANFIPYHTSLNVNNLNSPAPTLNSNNSLVLLPKIDVLSSGELVLEGNLAVAQVYVEQALVFFEQKQWDKSIDACQRALRIYPNMGEAYKVWGNCLQQSGNSAEAIGIYAKALEIQPDMAEIYCNLGSIYAKGKKWQQAIEHFQKSIIIAPNNATPYRNLARVWDELEEYEKSSDCFFKAIEIEPQLISAQNHFDLANNFLEEEQLERAIACYKNCLQLEPKQLNAYVRLAEALEQNGQPDEARFYYKKLAQLQIGDQSQSQAQSKTRQQIHGFLYPKSQSSTPISQPQAKSLGGANIQKPIPQLQAAQTLTIQEKIAQCRLVIQQKPNSAVMQMKLGNLYFYSQQWQKAIECCLKAIKIAPKRSEYYLNLGRVLEKVGDNVKASQAFYQGFSLNPEQVTAKNHYLLGNKLLEQKQIKPAIACYRRAISKQPDFIHAYWQLGVILIGIGNYQGAIACYRQALKVNPHQARSYFLLGKVFCQQEQWQPALNCYQKAAELEPNNADIQHNLGEVLAHEQKWEQAIESFRQAIKIDQNYAWSHYHLGVALMELHEWQPAKTALIDFIKLKPDFYWSHYRLGDIGVKTQDWDEAVIAYRRALEIDPDSQEMQEKLNDVLHKRATLNLQEVKEYYQNALKQEPEAESLYFRALEITPDDPEIYIQLANMYQKKGDLEQAIAFCKIALQLQPNNSKAITALETLKSQLS